MKTGLNKPKYSLGEAPTKDKQKYSRSTGPVDRQRSDLRLWESGRPGGRPKSQVESDHSLSVDRTGRPEQTESSALSTGRPGRSTDVHNAHWCMLVDRLVDRLRAKTFCGNLFGVDL